MQHCYKTRATFKKYVQKDVYLRQMRKVADNFRRYINQMVIIGFNSGSYHNNLIHGELTKILYDFDDRKLTQHKLYTILQNAAYGSFFMRRDKHQRITIAKNDY